MEHIPGCATAPLDTGILEIYDPERDEVQRIALESLTLGEVRLIGSSIENASSERAALIMTPRGPLLESRGAPLWFEGRMVKQHLLYDNDHLYLGRLVLYYHNFFRQRQVAEGGMDENAA